MASSGMKRSEQCSPVKTPAFSAIFACSHSRWLLNRTVSVARGEGILALLRRVQNKLARVLRGEATLLPFETTDPDVSYQQWRMRHAQPANLSECLVQQLDDSEQPPHFALVMKLSRPDAGLIEKALQSLRAQTYGDWRLLLWSTGEIDPASEWIVRDCSRHDQRILYQRDGPINISRTCGENATASMWFLGVMGQHDELAPDALCVMAKHILERPNLEALYSDHDSVTRKGWHCEPRFKPNWSPDLLLSVNYISSLCFFRRTVLAAMGISNLCELEEGAYPILLQLAEREAVVEHIPDILYHRRCIPQKPEDSAFANSTVAAQVSAVEAALLRRREQGNVTRNRDGTVEISRQPDGDPLISILIPTRDGCELLKRCIESVEGRTNYQHYEIIVLDNESIDPLSLSYLDDLKGRWRVVRCPGDFNFAAMNNRGAGHARGEYLLFLNNDVEVRSGDWLERMLAQAQRRRVGAVGAKLLYPDGSIQHAGVVVGIRGTAGHAFRHQPDDGRSYWGFADKVRNCSAVTAACMMVSKETFMMIRGFDEQFPVEFNDVDLCLRIRQQGYRIVYDPAVVLYHHENATRKGRLSPSDEKRFVDRWRNLLVNGDPYYNPNLTLRREDWSLDV